MFANKGKYCETRLDTGPAATTAPHGVDPPLVNGSHVTTHTEDMDLDSSLLCDSRVSCNTSTSTSDKTILLEEIEESGASKIADSSVSFEVPNISQNFTLNVGPSVGSIAAIQNVVPSGNPTLWLPTIIASNTSTSENRLLESEVEGSPGNLSQIILSGNGTHSNPVQSNNNYTPKVQIFTIPKQSSLSQPPPISSIKTMVHTTYLNQSDVKTRNTTSFNNSVLNNQIPNKNTLSGIPFVSSGGNQPHHVQTKSVSVSSSGLQMVNMPSSTNRSASKATSVAQHQSHVLSRIVPGPKMSSQPVGRSSKSNTVQYHKPPGRTSFSNVLQPQSVQTPMSVKIVQQQNVPLNNKTTFKSASRSGVLTPKQRASTSNSAFGQTNSYKQGTYSKSMSGVSVTKPGGRNLPQRLVVQQTPSRLMISGNVGVGVQGGYNRTSTQYYQQPSSDSHHNYMDANPSLPTNSSSNQSLTAQILQSLSQPKIISSRFLPTQDSVSSVQYDGWDHHIADSDSDIFNQCKQIQGDPSTSRSQDDTLGIEERPKLSDDSLSHDYYRLQLVMLDHTYAVTPQSVVGSSSSSITTPSVTNSNISSTSHPAVSSPVKALPSPTLSPVTHTPIEANYGFTNIPSRTVEEADDDAGSVLSSIDGEERRQGERNGSDTETAPEGEGEEEGKTRCVCEFTHDDGYMICCDRCGEWQHVDCMAIDRQNIPDDYMCDRCQPRLIDRKRARSIQMRKKVELTGLYSSASDSSSGASGGHKKPLGGKAVGPQKKLLTVTTYSNTIGGVSRTVPMLTPQQSSSYTTPYQSTTVVPPVVNNKRGPKRARRVDNGRKGPKRKLPEKKVRRKSEVAKYRNKYCTNSSQQVNQWSESYEQAMTNHYSPELRAKIARYSSNKQGTNHTVTSSVLTAHFCTTVPHAGSKILIATKDMKENSPIIELRGKYMLSTQHKPQPQPAGRAGSQRPGPYLFFYKFPKDLTQVCIDTRTYGNEARFVRRSCKPNAELQHCIIKGALHVYLVTINPIQSNTEITIRHEASGSYQPCACGNPKHCKQSPSTSPPMDIIHKNNGASSDSTSRERRGRTRHVSSSAMNLPSTPTITSPHRKEVSGPKVDKRRKSEPESVVHSDIKLVDESNSKPVTIKVEPNLESDLEAIKGVDIKQELKKECMSPTEDTAISIKEEKNSEDLKQNVVLKEEECKDEPKDVKLETLEDSSDVEMCKTVALPLISPTQSSVCDNTGTGQKQREYKVNKTMGTRRTSTHSVRTTRASLSASNAAESADEKSDSQNECKVTAKEKKKMTREERKMEAIVKAIERMEKAEQRKLENKDKQTKRRESDPQQLCSVTSSSESKDHSEHPDEQQKPSAKGRPRRRGRSRTTSQSQLKNSSRINSVDSDNICTSEDEHHPLVSFKSSVSSDNYLDTPPVTSTESPYQTLTKTNAALKQSFDRINIDLSSVCMLVEAAVGPLETTFKSPKTKKAIMNEWLNKSPEPNVSYDIGSPDYTCTDNNNTSDHYTVKPSYLGRKSTESLVKAASTMIGNLSGGIISADSTPEKHSSSDGDTPTKNTLEKYSPSVDSPAAYPQRNLKRVARDLSRDSGEKNRTPKKMRRGVKNSDPSPLKRSLRSGGGGREADCQSSVGVLEVKGVSHATQEQPSPVVICLPPPPQHSAKKRWLRQAISEESDSPTAESPPNEMLTPLKKRRLARESLTSEATSFIQNDDVQCSSLPHTPVKEPSNSTLFPNNLEPVSTNCDSEIRIKESIVPISVTPESEEKLYHDLSSVNKEGRICAISTDNESSDTVQKTKMTDACSQNDTAQVDVCEGSSLELVNAKNNQEDETLVDSVEEKEPGDLVDCNLGSDGQVIDSKPESTSNLHSTQNSRNSSPILDEMDDIQKKIHSFHTENIQILKIRNKKQPKEKRKKVNLNFDLSVLDDQTVEVKLKCEKDNNPGSKSGAVNCCGTDVSNTNSNPVTPENNTADQEDSSSTGQNCEVTENEKETNAVNTNKENIVVDTVMPALKDVSDIYNNSLNNNFPSSVLFSDTFRSTSSILDVSGLTTESSTSAVPDIIKNVIDMTVNLENSVFKDADLNAVDEYKNVEEILSRVNQMDSRNSVLLSGLMKDSTLVEEVVPLKVSQPSRSNDPRLNPPPCDKPKPIRRKLSITEYRRRHSMVHPSESSSSPPPAAEPSPQSHLSEDEEEFEKKMEASITKLDNIMSTMNMGILNPEPSVHDKHREKLSERLRREFGLTIPEEEMTYAPVVAEVGGRTQEQVAEDGISVMGLVLAPPPPPPPDPPPHVRLDG